VADNNCVKISKKCICLLKNSRRIGIMEKQNQAKKEFLMDLGCWLSCVTPAMDVMSEKVIQVLIIRNCRRTKTFMM
jgi:hypothetical protein